MTKVTIYHNPRCSKSRQTLALLRDRGIEPEIIEYLQNPPDVIQLQDIVSRLKVEPQELVRAKEHRALEMEDPQTARGWLEHMAKNPQIIQRPIVVKGKNACLGRPPENVLEMI